MDLISHGDFNLAAELIEKAKNNSKTSDTTISGLAEIVEGFSQIEKQRQEGREAAYAEELKRLDKFKAGPDANDIADSNEPADVNDVNDIDLDDPNDIRLVLSVVTKAWEFANDDQKKELLADDYVKETIAKAKDKAAGFEVEGKWLEAYTNVYGWLAAIEPNNQNYLDYAEQLLDKAEIAASFEDSPCETSEDRYRGVKKEMFTLAVYALGMDYVEVPDYRQMAKKALERCKLLGEVLGNPARFFDKPADPNGANSDWFSSPDKQQLSAWLSAMAAVDDEVNALPAGFGRKEFLDVFEKTLKLNKATAQMPEEITRQSFHYRRLFGTRSSYHDGLAQAGSGIREEHDERVHRNRS